MFPDELERYHRQLLVIGEEGQEKLRKSTVLVVGVGGLGSIASLYLAASGVGRLVLIDNGLVELSNLQRQILYTTDDLGRPKVYCAAKRLGLLNPSINIHPIYSEASSDLLRRIISEVDLVVDGLDNWETRIIVDKICYELRKPFIHAGIHGFYGQLYIAWPGKTPCLRCVFPRPPKRTDKPIPVFSTTPGILGLLEANEALKILTGVGEPLLNKILVYDGRTGLFDYVEIKSSDCKVCEE